MIRFYDLQNVNAQRILQMCTKLGDRTCHKRLHQLNYSKVIYCEVSSVVEVSPYASIAAPCDRATDNNLLQ